MAKSITKQELAELGASVKVKHDPEVREIARLGDLIEKLNELIAQNTQRTTADLARSQAQLEVLGTLQKMIRAQDKGTKSFSQEPIDLSPLREVLAEISASRAAVPYVFDIKRGAEGGPMQQVIATPQPPTLN